MALRNLLLRVGADVSGLKKSMSDAERSVQYFGRSVGDAMKGLKGKLAGGLGAIAGGMLMGEGVKDAMQYEALMTTLGESMGKSRAQFEEWQKTTGRAMGFSMLQSAKLANTLSLNFKQIATSQEDLTAKTTKMMEVAAVIANKRGLTMEEVSDRIRSAMNQEADGANKSALFGRNAKVIIRAKSVEAKPLAS